ncbi:hypothetical protein [Brachybacterium kimchii]|uniref:Uncharacterized protein n=1 Tax=Brachybacterium kimchii TaxID=2942909 RepID=A0ABY4N4H1_9MICO|nr:hypothetical protein [Brachybacterium kimchii]UQN29463.1 hypothetical protein M4486_17790 [Brachybacterium kimchii]
MTHTADDFRTARFATHPDGRIAARAGGDSVQWRTSGYPVWESDESMAAAGWSPLSESLPSTVTDKMVQAAMDAAGQSMPAPWWGGTEWRSYTGEILTAALSAAPAPTGDEAEALGLARAGEAHAERLRAEWQEAAERERTRAAEAEAALEDLREQYGTAVREKDEWEANEQEQARRADDAEASAALWKETARHLTRKIHDEDGLVMRAIRGGQHCNDVAAGWKARAVKTELERARLQAELNAVLWGSKDRTAAMTARDHLDAAWEAAHVPADGTIPEGAEYLERVADGPYMRRTAAGPLSCEVRIPGGAIERRLLDPPTPKRPEGAEAIQVVLDEWFATDQEDRGKFAEFLAERGVRAPEDGEGER